MRQEIALRDPAAPSRAPELRRIDLLLGDDPPHGRRERGVAAGSRRKGCVPIRAEARRYKGAGRGYGLLGKDPAEHGADGDVLPGAHLGVEDAAGRSQEVYNRLARLDLCDRLAGCDVCRLARWSRRRASPIRR